MSADEITAWSTVALTAVTTLGVGVAWFQLSGIKKGLEMSTLMAVLEIETQMNERKQYFDERSAAVRQSRLQNEAPELQRIHADLFNSAKENYFNALDRLCFCILKEYLRDKDWRTEYRNVIKNVIDTHTSDFNEASPFRNIKKVNNKWQDQ